MGEHLPHACVVSRISGASPHLKTVPKWPHRAFPPRPLSNLLHPPSRWRTLYTLLDSDSGPIYTTNALIVVPRPSLSAESYRDQVPEPCSTYERLSSSPLLPSSLRLSSPRATPRRSLKHNTQVRIIAVRRALCRPLLKFYHEDPNAECTVYSYPPVAQNIQNFPTIWQPATLLASDSDGQALWQKIASGVPNIPPKGQLNGSTVNVTYDSANDPACCEWRFFSPALPFQEGKEGRVRSDRQSLNSGLVLSGTCRRHVAAVRHYETIARKPPWPCLYAPPLVTDE
jgi:hypothetical protein